MTRTTRLWPAAIAAALLSHGIGRADGAVVQIKKWKLDPVELLDRPDGAVVATKPAAALPMQAERMGQGWLKVRVGEQDYYVESSQARTDLKLSGKPKCENLGGTAGSAASRGLGDPGCEP
jgi:hypothetical protein